MANPESVVALPKKLPRKAKSEKNPGAANWLSAWPLKRDGAVAITVTSSTSSVPTVSRTRARAVLEAPQVNCHVSRHSAPSQPTLLNWLVACAGMEPAVTAIRARANALRILVMIDLLASGEWCVHSSRPTPPGEPGRLRSPFFLRCNRGTLPFYRGGVGAPS